MPILKRFAARTGFWLLRLAAFFAVFSAAVVLALRWINPPTTSFMVQRRLAALNNPGDTLTIHYQWAGRENIPDHTKMAAIASEDQDFAGHWGLDLGSIKKAVKEYEHGEELRGASTITQQVAKNLFLWPDKSYIRKGIEAYLAVLIEWCWPKERILEVYLNIVEFGDGVYGVRCAAQRYFKKAPSRLFPHESALMMTALPAPKRYNLSNPSPYMYGRRDWVLRYMDLLGNATYLRKFQ